MEGDLEEKRKKHRRSVPRRVLSANKGKNKEKKDLPTAETQEAKTGVSGRVPPLKQRKRAHLEQQGKGYIQPKDDSGPKKKRSRGENQKGEKKHPP